jgi:hypothetical protein
VTTEARVVFHAEGGDHVCRGTEDSVMEEIAPIHTLPRQSIVMLKRTPLIDVLSYEVQV